MPKPTMVLHAILHLGFFASICFSCSLMGLSRSIPFDTPTTHVAHVPSAPQSPTPPESNRRLSASFNFTPLVSMALRRFSPANSSMVASGSSCSGGNFRVMVTFGLRLNLFTVTRIVSSSVSICGRSKIASTVASNPRHSVDTAVSSFTSERPAPPPPLALFLRTVSLETESPGIIPHPSEFPPSTTPSTRVMPSPSSRPPAISRSSNPNPPALFTSKVRVSTNSSFDDFAPR
mmetsp:Transcript_57698/g.172162  ORF Transcript_57698/g.172162 Transcript_57698/m.172162 type:complete len:233 (-) Transcript_57698:376-1074(-)